MRRFLLFMSIVIIYSCNNNKKKNFSLEGNWYTASLGKDTIKDFGFRYQELYFSNKKIFYFDNHLGFKPPNYYKLKNDSLFISFFFDKDFIFFSEVIYNDNQFSLIDKQDSLNFYRLENVKNSLDKFIIINDSISDFQQKGTEFTQGFIDREDKHFTKLTSKK